MPGAARKADTVVGAGSDAQSPAGQNDGARSADLPLRLNRKPSTRGCRAVCRTGNVCWVAVRAHDLARGVV